MMQAWLILPALAAAYLVAAPVSFPRRARDVALAGVLTVAVSLSWMSAVSLVPKDDRPYVDGTTNDSVFSQVFDYNGIARLAAGDSTPVQDHRHIHRQASPTGETLNNQTSRIKPSWHRLLNGPFGRDDGWLLPAADRRRCSAAHADEPAATTGCALAVILWGTWLLVLGTVFSVGRYLNSYYVAALSPATAALCGVGVELLWRERHRPAARIWLAVTVLASAVYGAYLLRGGSHVPTWLLFALLLGVIASGAALLTTFSGHPRTAALRIAGVVGCALLLAASTSALSVVRGLGPFDTPYAPTPAFGRSKISPRLYDSGAEDRPPLPVQLPHADRVRHRYLAARVADDLLHRQGDPAHRRLRRRYTVTDPPATAPLHRQRQPSRGPDPDQAGQQRSPHDLGTNALCRFAEATRTARNRIRVLQVRPDCRSMTQTIVKLVAFLAIMVFALGVGGWLALWDARKRGTIRDGSAIRHLRAGMRRRRRVRRELLTRGERVVAWTMVLLSTLLAPAGVIILLSADSSLRTVGSPCSSSPWS